MWREESLMLHLLLSSVNPKLGLQDSVEHWDKIAGMLQEPPRKRVRQLVDIDALGVLLS